MSFAFARRDLQRATPMASDSGGRFTLSELEYMLKQTVSCVHPGTKKFPQFNKQPWYPFSETDSHRRCVHVLDEPEIGTGGFGIVHAVALRVCDTTPPQYVLAAMKTVPIVYDLATEVTAALSLTRLTHARVTPNIVRLLDTFCISSFAQQLDLPIAVAYPSRAWTKYWLDVDRFVRSLDSCIVNHHGRHAVNSDGRGDNASQRRLARGHPLAYAFYELSIDGLLARYRASNAQQTPVAIIEHHHLIYNSDSTTQSEDSTGPKLRQSRTPARHNSREAIDQLVPVNSKVLYGGCTTARRQLAVNAWQQCHAIASLAAIDVGHGDIHSGNFVRHVTGGRLRTDISFISQSKGDGSLKSSVCEDDIYYATVPQFDSLSSERVEMDWNTMAQCVHLNPNDARVTLIDFGGCRRFSCPSNDGVLADASESDLKQRVKRLGRAAYTHEISDRMPAWDPYIRWRISGLVPNQRRLGCMALGRAITNRRTRPPEQFNPRVTAIVKRRDRNWGTRAVFSTRSDVYSLAVVLCSEIVGFHIFSTKVLCRMPGIPTTSHALGIQLVRASQTFPASYYTAKGPLDLTFRRHLSNNDADIWTLEIDRLRPKLDGLLDQTMRAAWKTPKHHNMKCQFTGYRLNTRGREGWAPDQKADLSQMLMTRIMALGLPPSDCVRGTVLEPVFKKYRSASSPNGSDTRGWLENTLLRTLAHHYNFPRPVVVKHTELLMAALSWDPGQRPDVRLLLQSPLFDQLKIPLRVDEIPRLWSCERPHPLLSQTDSVAINTYSNYVSKLSSPLAQYYIHEPPSRFNEQPFMLHRRHCMLPLTRRETWHLLRRFVISGCLDASNLLPCMDFEKYTMNTHCSESAPKHSLLSHLPFDTKDSLSNFLEQCVALDGIDLSLLCKPFVGEKRVRSHHSERSPKRRRTDIK